MLMALAQAWFLPPGRPPDLLQRVQDRRCAADRWPRSPSASRRSAAPSRRDVNGSRNFNTARIEDPKLLEELDAAGVKYTGRVRQPLAAGNPRLGHPAPAALRPLELLLPAHGRRRRRRHVVRAQQAPRVRRRRREGQLRRRRRRGRGRAGAQGDRRVPEEPEEVHRARRPHSEGRAARRPARAPARRCWRAPSPARPRCPSSA